MASITINGTRVPVSDNFFQLSPEEQDATVDEIAQEMGAQAPVSTAEDVLKSGSSGFARGAADLVGLPGTIGDALRGGGEWALRKGYEVATGRQPTPQGGAAERFFAGPTPEVNAQLIGGGSNPVGGANLKRVMGEATGGATDYQPQGVPGEFARTFGEFAPAALAGPGGIGRKAAMAAIPAVASETAGQATKGTSYEPWARAGAALGTGMLTAGVGNPIKAAAKGAPTKEALKAHTDNLYTALRGAGIKYDSNSYGAMVQKATDDLLKQGFRQNSYKPAFNFIDDLAQDVGRSPDFDDVNNMVQRAGELARGAAADPKTKSLAKAFGIIRDNLDDFERNAPLMSASPLPPATLNHARDTARNLALRNIKQRALDEVVRDADTYRSGVEAGTRNGILKLLKSSRGKQLFNESERTALLQVARGRKPLEQLSRFGFDLTQSSGNAIAFPAAMSVLAGTALGPVAGTTLGIGGTVAKAISPAMTKRALDQASAAIRGGKLSGPGGVQISNQLIDQNVRRFLAGQNAANAARTPPR